MASDNLSIQEVRTFIFQSICEQLSAAEVRAIAYTENLPPAYYDKSAIEVLLKLEMKDRYSVSNLLPLSEILKKIDRKDLAKKVEKYRKKQSRKNDSIKSVVDVHKHTDYLIEATLKVTKLQTRILLEQMEELKQSLRNGGMVRIEHAVAEAVEIIEYSFQKKLMSISGMLAINYRSQSSVESQSSVSPTNSILSESSSEGSLDVRSQTLESKEYVLAGKTCTLPMHQSTSVSLQDSSATSQVSSQLSDDQYEELGPPLLSLEPQGDDLRAKPCPLPTFPPSLSSVMNCTPQKTSQIEMGEIVTGRDNLRRAKPSPPPKKPKPKNIIIATVQNTVDSDYSGGSCSGGIHGDYSGGSGSTSTGDSGFVEAKRYLKTPLTPEQPTATTSTYIPLNPEGIDGLDYYKTRTVGDSLAHLSKPEVNNIPALPPKPKVYRKKTGN